MKAVNTSLHRTEIELFLRILKGDCGYLLELMDLRLCYAGPFM